MLTLFAISLLRPEVRYYKNGVVINPTKLFASRKEEGEAKEVTKTCIHPKEESGSDSGSDEEFIIQPIRELKFEKLAGKDQPEAYLPRCVPTGHFVKPTETSNVFLKIEKGKTCFMMIKSHQFYDVQVALKAGVWSSTSHGNKILQAAYEEFVVKRGGNVYLFFSVNKSGHICAFAELVSSKLDSVPDIWLEKQKYTGCFLVRFLLVKNIPMNNFIDMVNEEGLPIKRCRDTDTIGFEEGMIMAKTCLEHFTASSLLLESPPVDFSSEWNSLPSNTKPEAVDDLKEEHKSPGYLKPKSVALVNPDYTTEDFKTPDKQTKVKVVGSTENALVVS